MSTLRAKLRDKGSKPKQLRRQGILPMAVVGRDHNTTEIMAPENDLRKAIAGADGHGQIDLEVEGSKRCKALIKQIDKDYIHGGFIHVTLQEVRQEDEMKLDVPVVAVGVPEPIDNNQAVLVHPTDHLKLKGRIMDLPERIEVDISGLGMEESISAGQIQLPDNVALVTSPDAILFLVQTLRAEQSEEQAMEEEASTGGGPEQVETAE